MEALRTVTLASPLSDRSVIGTQQMNKAPAKRKPVADRRSGADRRHVEGSPPGKHERRRRTEARQPDVTEIEMTEAEWIKLSQELTPPPPAKKKA